MQECIEEVMESFKPEEVLSVGITNQRETTVVWDRVTGKPLHNALVWLDVRSTSVCDRLIEEHGSKDAFRSICGLPISSYFSAMKLVWLLENVPDVKTAVDEGRCMFGTVDSWLIYVSRLVVVVMVIHPPPSLPLYTAKRRLPYLVLLVCYL